MTLALLSAAGAVLLWPDARAVLRHRVRQVTPAVAGSRTGPAVPLPVAAAVLAAGIGSVLSTPLVAALAAACAALAVRGWRSRRAEAVEGARLAVLAESLAALAAELRAGRLLGEAAEGVAEACPDRECAAALLRAVRGSPPQREPGGGEHDESDGLTGALARLSAAVALSARTGCSLATVVSAVEDDLRARLRRRRELLVATAGPRSSARLLAGLPVLGLALGSGAGADPWGVLTTTGTGQALLVGGVALEVAGIAWTGRLVRRIAR
ncbi:type II secretion system F family protein [Blastococcus saxobsidens]|uniref:Tight adherence protein B n=1 Tax=Blastococcus saxobsidens TaxID=138336 RepID=A0A4Q7YB48_9ACTN|nr:pilus assembly protein TadB [Blastococcus saxobsidens]RZU34280.1 tight adherence protein B [Blastococcus saxobsidens]